MMKNIKTIAQEYLNSQRVSETDYQNREDWLKDLKDFARNPVNEFKFTPEEWAEFDAEIEQQG